MHKKCNELSEKLEPNVFVVASYTVSPFSFALYFNYIHILSVLRH